MAEAQLITSPTQRLSSLLDQPSIKKRFESMLGDRHSGFLSSIISVVNGSDRLKECDPMSVIAAASVAASMDLPIHPSLGLGYIIPFKQVATFQIGWKGVYQLAMRSGMYKTINQRCVYDGQLISRDSFTGEMKLQEARKSDVVIGYLLYFKLLTGFEKFHYVSRDDMEKHAKKYSQTYQKGFGFWKDDFDAQGLKTVIKLGLQKYGILSIELQKAFAVDGAQVDDNGEVVARPDEHAAQVQEPARPESDRLAEVVGKQAIPAEASKDAKDIPL